MKLLERIFRRRHAYRSVLLGTDGLPHVWARIVLEDLARFCRANSSTARFAPTGALDPIASAKLDGRREVWLRIMSHLHLDDKYITNLKEEPASE